MGSGISCFDRWLNALDAGTRGLPRPCALEAVAQRAHEGFGARIWFAEILGPRWSHIAGTGTDGPVPSQIGRVPLGRRVGLVVETWGRLRQHDRGAFVDFLRRLVSSTGEAA